MGQQVVVFVLLQPHNRHICRDLIFSMGQHVVPFGLWEVYWRENKKLRS
jgi:hypothetical protein